MENKKQEVQDLQEVDENEIQILEAVAQDLKNLQQGSQFALPPNHPFNLIFDPVPPSSSNPYWGESNENITNISTSSYGQQPVPTGALYSTKVLGKRDVSQRPKSEMTEGEMLNLGLPFAPE